jgi:hypothetical protein
MFVGTNICLCWESHVLVLNLAAHFWGLKMVLSCLYFLF